MHFRCNRFNVSRRVTFALLLSVMTFASIGCSTIEAVKVDTGPYLLVERDTVRSLLVVEIFSRTAVPVPAASKSTTVLVEKVPPERGAPSWRSLVDHPLPYRDLGTRGIFYVALAIVRNSSEAPRWIIANEPSLVIGIGEGDSKPDPFYGARMTAEGRVRMGYGLRLASPSDAEAHIVQLRVLDRWPTSDEIAAFGPDLQVVPRVINLARPATVRELMAQRPWKLKA